MEEEIDLRPYFEALLHNWMWIVGAAVIAGVVALGVSFLISPTYEATALVAATQPRQLVQFDPRFEALDEGQPLRAFPELATSDEMLQDLLGEISPPLPDIETVNQLRGLLAAEAGSDPTLVRLTVSSGQATEAARIANAWAQLFVTRANEIYGDLGSSQVDFFESQLEEAKTELAAAEQALIEFQARDRSAIIQNELNSLKQEQADNLARQRRLAMLVADSLALRDQLVSQSGDGPAPFADQLTALMLQVQAFESDASAATPLQLQLDTTAALTGESRPEQINFLATLANTLQARSGQLEQKLAELEPQILAQQQQLQALQAENRGLTRDQDVATETYTALARKVEEERITSQDTSSGVRLASRAAVPERPSGTNKLLTAIVSASIGAFLAVFVVTVVYWWSEPRLWVRTPPVDNPARVNEEKS